MEQILREKGEVKRRREIGGGERGEKGGERRGKERKEKEERGSGGESGERRTRRERERDNPYIIVIKTTTTQPLLNYRILTTHKPQRNSPQIKLVSLP